MKETDGRSPLRTPTHVRAAVEMLRKTGADSVVTVVEVPKHLSPDYVMRVEDGRLVSFLPEGMRVTRRQDARPAFVRDGTAYVFWTKTLRATRSIYGNDCRPLVVPAEESITIDVPSDWQEAERRVVEVLDWAAERFQDALGSADLDPGLVHRKPFVPERRETRIRD